MNNEPFKRSVSINTLRPIYDLSRSGSTGSLYNSRCFLQPSALSHDRKKNQPTTYETTRTRNAQRPGGNNDGENAGSVTRVEGASE